MSRDQESPKENGLREWQTPTLVQLDVATGTHGGPLPTVINPESAVYVTS